MPDDEERHTLDDIPPVTRRYLCEIGKTQALEFAAGKQLPETVPPEARAALQEVDLAFLKHARHGDTPEAARYLCRRLAEHLAGGLPLHPKALAHLTEALRAIGEGADPAKALHLKLGKGKRERRLNTKNTRIRYPLLALEVHCLVVEQGMRATRNEATERESACSVIAEKYDIDEAYLNKIYLAERDKLR